MARNKLPPARLTCTRCCGSGLRHLPVYRGVGSIVVQERCQHCDGRGYLNLAPKGCASFIAADVRRCMARDERITRRAIAESRRRFGDRGERSGLPTLPAA